MVVNLTNDVQLLLSHAQHLYRNHYRFEPFGPCSALLEPSARGDRLSILKIVTPEEARGGRLASETLGRLCALADQHSVTLYLEALADAGSSMKTAQLVAWYERYGFHGPRFEMARPPA